ncbi:flagellar protein FlaG [Oxalobacteraceae bacterium GrIS 1.11]
MSIDSIGTAAPPRPSERDSTPAPVNGAPPAAPVLSRAAVKPTAPVPTLDQVTRAVSDLNKSAQANQRNIEFSVDKDSKRTLVKVVDQKTGEVLRQMPSAEALEIAKSLDEHAKGLLIKQTA